MTPKQLRDACGPMELVEVEPGMFQMTFQHGEHKHGMRALATIEGGPAKVLTDTYNVTVRLINEGRRDLAGCTEP